MKTVRAHGTKKLAVALCTVLVAAGLTAVAQKCGKSIGRGPRYPVAIHVALAGKPVAHAKLEIDTLHGAQVKQLKTDATGVANASLSTGDYIVTATTKDASGMAKVTVTATTPVAVTVTLSPTTN
jgi:hypothetical protein